MESLEEEATHATDEARMVLPGVQAILGFQLIAVFNQRFQELSEGRQILHISAFVLLAAAMGLIMTPAAYHRQAERGVHHASVRYVGVVPGGDMPQQAWIDFLQQYQKAPDLGGAEAPAVDGLASKPTVGKASGHRMT
jgi:Family of unknown function (DUF6328)